MTAITTNPIERAFLEALEQQQEAGRLRLAKDCELDPPENRFTPGMYSRTLRMPAGTVWLSKRHKTEHQFVISEGIADVWTEEAGWRLHEAGMIGITKPGTQRVLMILMDCVWTTFHPTDETDVPTLEAELCEPVSPELMKLAEGFKSKAEEK